MKSVIQIVDFKDITGFKNKHFHPIFLYFGDRKFFKVSSWYEAMKIIFNFLYKTPYGKEEIGSQKNKRLFKSETKYISDSSTSFDEIIDTGSMAVKFSGPDDLLYVKVYKKSTHPYNNLLLLQKLIKDRPEIQITLGVTDQDQSDNLKEYQKIEKTYKKRSIQIIRGRFFVGKLNQELLSKEELLQYSIGKQFDQKTLIGDITISDEEFETLKCFMQRELEVFKFGCSSINTKSNEAKLFCYGLVECAKRTYQKKTFWPYLNQEYNTYIFTSSQKNVLDFFKETMQRNGKKYDDDNKLEPIQNICMHTFVATPCSNQFFNYLFDYWRIDLQRNIENLNSEDGQKYFDILIDEIKKNKVQSVNNLMLHTTIALIENPIGCKNRLRNYLNLIDDWFYNKPPVLEENNSQSRLVRLLNKFALDPKSRFQKEYQIRKRNGCERGETFLWTPTLFFHQSSNTFYIKLPHQILRSCCVDEEPLWYLSFSNEFSITVTPKLLLDGKAGIYTEECACPIDDKCLFAKCSIELKSQTHSFCKFSIDSNEIRFFDEKGKLITYTNTIHEGRLNIFCQNETVSLVNSSISFTEFDYFKASVCEAEEGDIFILPNGKALFVGNKIQDGFIKEMPLHGVTGLSDTTQIPVFSKLPSYLFKANESQLGGSFVQINDKTFRLSSLNLTKFRIDDTIDDYYGFVINFADIIQDNGFYHFILKIAGSKKEYQEDFLFAKNFSFGFSSSLYFFKDSGVIIFDHGSRIVVPSDNEFHQWNNGLLKDSLTFSFEQNPDNEIIKKRQLYLKFNLGKDTASLAFDIPALYWGYQPDSVDNYLQPDDFFLKKIPPKIYVSGPFDLNKATLNIDSDLEDTQGIIEAEPTEVQNIVSFKINKVFSWITSLAVLRRPVIIKTNLGDHKFFDILCHSVVNNQQVYGDFDNNVIYGSFDISGGGKYSITISHHFGAIVAEDIPLIDGDFRYEAPIENGQYDIQVFELDESFDGLFDDAVSISIPLLDEPIVLTLFDIGHLVGQELKVGKIKQLKGYYPIHLKRIYTITLDKRILFEEYENLKSEINFWSNVELTKEKSIIYLGSLQFVNANGLQLVNTVLIVFPDKNKPSDSYVFRQDKSVYGTDYQELLLYKPDKTFVNDESRFKNIKARFLYLQTLDDDNYRLILEMGDRK